MPEKLFLRFCFSAFLLSLLFSCAPKRVELPSYEGVDIKTVIAERSGIKSVEATLSVEFEKDDNTMAGDAALDVTDNTLDLRVYSLGFLVGEVKEKDGVIKSKPVLSRDRSSLLVDGVRNSIIWWNIQDYVIEEKEGEYQLRNSRRTIIIDRKTMLPRYQSIELDGGKEIRIFYEEPMISGGFWYQSRMRIELSKYTVRLQIKTISFSSRSDPGQQQQRL